MPQPHRSRSTVPLFLAVSLLMTACGGASSGTSTAKPASGAAASSKPLRIGVLAPLTGVSDLYGPPLVDGAKIAANLINKSGGILGRKIVLNIADTAADPAVGVQKATELITSKHDQFLIGTISSAVTLAVDNVVDKYKVPFFYVIEGEQKTCLPSSTKIDPYVFANATTPGQQLKNFVPFMIKKWGPKVYIVASNFVYDRYVAKGMQHYLKQDGGKLVGLQYVPLTENNFSTVISKVRAAKPNVLFISVIGPEGATLIRQSYQFGLNKQMAITGTPTFDPEVYSGFKQYANGDYTIGAYSGQLTGAANKQFVAAWRAKYTKGPVPEVAGAGVYASFMQLKAAIEKAKSFNPAKVVKAIPGLNLNLTQGQVIMNPKNHIATTHVYLLQIENGKYNVVKDLGMVPAQGVVGCSRK